MTTVPTDIRIEQSTARRIGFLADTHVQEPTDLPVEVLHAFEGVDLIVHRGHVGNIALLDHLAAVAPTIAVVVGLDERQNTAALAGYTARIASRHRIIETPWASIGVQFNFSNQNNADSSYPPPYLVEQGATHEYVREQFGRPVDVVVSANTHLGSIHVRDGVLFVDPGSPNLPGGWRKGGLGTVAILDEHDGFVRAEIVDLERLPA